MGNKHSSHVPTSERITTRRKSDVRPATGAAPDSSSSATAAVPIHAIKVRQAPSSAEGSKIGLPPSHPQSQNKTSTRRKSDLRVDPKLLGNLGVAASAAVSDPVPAGEAGKAGKPEAKSDSPSVLQRARSALPPSLKSALSVIRLTSRSKSMPVVSQRRADINLDDDALAEVTKLQASLKAKFGMHNPDSEALHDVVIDSFIDGCDAFVYGAQKLTGTPGEAREIIGEFPSYIAVSCIKGMKGPSDTGPNQDNFSYCKYRGHEFYTVQDGHGPGGHFVSYRGIRTLPLYITESRHFPSNLPAAIAEGYEQCNADILKHSVEQGFDVQISGAACVMVVRNGPRLWLTHTGDSRAVVGTSKSVDVMAETADHKPTNPEEKTRLEAAGSEVQTFHFDNNVAIARVFVKGTDYPGLCMSRSLGDQCVKTHGVTPLPEVRELTIVEGQTYVVVASDGVWEFVPSTLVCQSLSKKLKSEGKTKCVARIVTESKKRWKSNEGNYCDDITALLINL